MNERNEFGKDFDIGDFLEKFDDFGGKLDVIVGRKFVQDSEMKLDSMR